MEFRELTKEELSSVNGGSWAGFRKGILNIYKAARDKDWEGLINSCLDTIEQAFNGIFGKKESAAE